MRRGLKYVANGDCYSQMAQEDLHSTLFSKAKIIQKKFLAKSNDLSVIKRFFGRVSNQEQTIQKVCNRIKSYVYCEFRIPEVVTRTKGFFNRKVEYFLTGETQVERLEGVNSSGLQKNFEHAKKIIAYVQNKVLFSYNYLHRSNVMRSLANDSQMKLYNVYKNEVSKGIANIRKSSPEKRKTIMTEEGVGNCGEMAACGFDYATKELNIQVQWRCIGGGDHEFLVIGEGKDRVVCDAWTGAYFPLSSYQTYLTNYLGHTDIEGISMTQVEPWNSTRHSLLKY